MANTRTPIKPAGWAVISLLVLGLAWSAVKLFAPNLLSQLAGGRLPQPSSVPPKADLPSVGVADTAATTTAMAPVATAGCTDKSRVNMLVWAWNAQQGLLFANGGAQAAEGSLMCGHGVNLALTRQDDTEKMKSDLVSFASALKAGDRNPQVGAHFVVIMGDGGANFLAPLNAQLKALGPDYIAQVVGAVGYSRGEDKFIGLPDWRTNAQNVRQHVKNVGGAAVEQQAGLIAGYLRDGDWNIALKWAADNGLCNNPDEKSYNPNCLNWFGASDYIDAAQKYVSGYCEDRPVVNDRGERSGQTKHVCVNGVVTWTPGDVTVAQKRGGLVSIVSTEVYRSQMPAVVIGIKKWMQANPATVEGLLAAALEGGQAVRTSSEAQAKAAAISAAVYKEQDAAYWAKYFHPVEEQDATGLTVRLGGSSVNNLADAIETFGLRPGSADLFTATYTVFGNIVHSQYPGLLGSFPKASEILDVSYLKAVAQRSAGREGAPDRISYAADAKTFGEVGRRIWKIEFQSGQAVFSDSAQATLSELERQLLIANATRVAIHGYTDDVGQTLDNRRLSERRAFAVRNWLKEQSALNFPESRLPVFAHGDENPLESNDTAAGRAKNRRVEIVLEALASN